MKIKGGWNMNPRERQGTGLITACGFERTDVEVNSVTLISHKDPKVLLRGTAWAHDGAPEHELHLPAAARTPKSAWETVAALVLEAKLRPHELCTRPSTQHGRHQSQHRHYQELATLRLLSPLLGGDSRFQHTGRYLGPTR